MQRGASTARGDGIHAPEPVAATMSSASRVALDGVALDDLLLLLDGVYPLGRRYLDSSERQLVSGLGRLPDGTPWDLPLTLRLPCTAGAVVDEILVLTDIEGVPVASVRVEEVTADDGGALVAGPARRLPVGGPRSGGRLRASASGRLVGVVASRPLYEDDLCEAARLAEETRSGLLLIALTGAGRPFAPQALVRSFTAVAKELGAGVRPVRLPAHPELGRARESRLAVQVAARLGATRVLLVRDDDASTELGDDLPVPVHPGPSPLLSPAALHRRVSSGLPLPEGLLNRGAEAALRGSEHGPRGQGVVLLLTGLSGSGKSTIAAAVAEAVSERAHRQVTVLDGDRVRSLLSSELGFSRHDRDLNVRRIGYVASEIARHGGIAVCAPIAPYAESRAEVRSMAEAVGEFALVHVATPLEVCERRDRKGLYARARAGLLPGFTGVSDPYEDPDDADLVIDTSTQSVDHSVDAVLALLARRGVEL